MIMFNSRRPSADRTWYASTLARYVSKRRAELGLTAEQAAELAGMQLCQWLAIEANWVPNDTATMRALAETLSIRWLDLELMAVFARCAQHAA